VYLLVFHAYINEMHGSRSKIPSKKYRQAALRCAEGFNSGVKGLRGYMEPVDWSGRVDGDWPCGRRLSVWHRRKLIFVYLFQNSFCTPAPTEHWLCYTDRHLTAVCSHNTQKHINTLCVQNPVELVLIVTIVLSQFQEQTFCNAQPNPTQLNPTPSLWTAPYH
jgi:hypothetical protein